jgi:Flp pilus assembly protein TadD
MIAAQSGHRDEAIRDLHRLVERYPHHAAAMVNLGLLHEAAGDAASAEYWLLRARPLLPDKELADGPLRRLRTPSSGSPR